MLVVLVLGVGFDLVRGNAAKMFLILSFLPIALLLFALADQVDWAAGLVLAAGHVVGALLASTLAVKRGPGWVRWVLMVAAVAAALRMLLA